MADGSDDYAADDEVRVIHSEKKGRPDDTDDLSTLSPLPPFEKELKPVPVRYIKAVIKGIIDESNEVPIELNLLRIQMRSAPDKSFSPPDIVLVDRVIRKICSQNYHVQSSVAYVVKITPKKK